MYKLIKTQWVKNPETGEEEYKCTGVEEFKNKAKAMEAYNSKGLGIFLYDLVDQNGNTII